MKIHNLQQGSPEWNALRAGCYTASEASAMMGQAKSTSRNELLRLKHTGGEKEFSSWAQRFLLDKGHGIEKKALPIAQEAIGEDLYPCTGTSDNPLATDKPYLLASFDGLTMLGTIAWECKSWNEEKAAEVRAGNVPECDRWQVVQQLLVSGAEKCLYMVTDGTPEKTVWCWYEAKASDFKELLAGWLLFDEDLASYEYVEQKAPVVAATVEGLPAINYRLNGLALTSNLDVFRKAAEKLVEDSKQPLNTDQEFADREALCKRFVEAEAKIKLLREQVIGEFKDVDAFTRELGEIGELIRKARLAGESQVKTRKEAIRNDIKTKAESALAAHIAECNKRLGSDRVTIPRIIDNFAAAMKGKRNLDSIQDAVDEELARLKLEANAVTDHMAVNLATLREKAKGFEGLFRDAQELLQKDAEAVALIIDARISEHKQQQEDAERERQAEERRQQEQLQAAIGDPQAIKSTTTMVSPVEQAEEAQVLAGVAGGYADGDSYRLAGEREPDLLDTSAEVIPVGNATRVEIMDMRELVKAVAAGQVPLGVLAVNMDVLSQLCEMRGQAMPGTRWSKA